jgi:hypothetical protein
MRRHFFHRAAGIDRLPQEERPPQRKPPPPFPYDRRALAALTLAASISNGAGESHAIRRYGI